MCDEFDLENVGMQLNSDFNQLMPAIFLFHHLNNPKGTQDPQKYTYICIYKIVDIISGQLHR